MGATGATVSFPLDESGGRGLHSAASLLLTCLAPSHDELRAGARIGQARIREGACYRAGAPLRSDKRAMIGLPPSSKTGAAT